VAARLIKDVIRLFVSVTNVPITKELVISARKSYGEYVRYQEEKRCLEALEKQKKEQEETLAENVRQGNKRKEDILTQLQSQETKEEKLTKEQNTALVKQTRSCPKL